MARLRTRRNPAPIGKDELAEGAPTDGSYTSTPAVFQAQTPTPAPAPIISSTDELC